MGDDDLYAVRFAGASLHYGPITALDEIALTIGRGEKVALVGRSGAGKSSLLDAISGRVSLTAGAVQVFEQDLAALRGRSARATRRRIGIVAQGLDLALPLRVVHNVNAGRLGSWSTLGAVWSLLRPAVSGRSADALARVGLQDRLLARTSDLSGGERQRVAIARVLRQQPDLMLADEPTASVDPKLADDMMGLLCHGNHTLVVSAHDPGLARRHVDRMVGMRGGNIVFDLASADVSDSQLADFYDQ